ncbi:ribosome rescue GTPase HflX [Solimonas terrae]|uniref:GTPase HflX n=1 Tax=Solimonas terrae TaxID=1396819 RepID=A0A6M2BNP7_9GAMM|nr:ribosome rescue GTPase HflX [Solimonas terrae]NGY03831.1 GTPase HflX [Solimonas terrae]
MFERPKAGQKALLVHLEFPGADFESDRQEFIELARSAGADIIATIGGSRRDPDPGLFVGSGKAQEVADAVAASGAELVIFNHALSPSQERNLERLVKARVLDRAGLILDIFATRARSHEGKLQVELAQLQHVATRLIRGWTHLERQRGGGIGLRGPGETQLEMDRRLIKGRIATLKRHLETVRGRRAQNRASRVRNNVPTASIVGYTNAGKSTLFNAMTGDATFASSQLFATLDTTVRRLPLASGDTVLLADTVGFIRDLPHDLVAAFRATLEEARDAELLLHVVDSADPERMSRIVQVEEVLQEIGAEEVPCLQVFNKIDLRDDEQPRIERDEFGVPTRVYVSARDGLGLELLREAIAERLLPRLEVQELSLPPSAARLRAQLFTHHAVRAERIDEHGNFHLQVAMPYARLQGLCAAAGVTPPPSPHVVEEWELSP